MAGIELYVQNESLILFANPDHQSIPKGGKVLGYEQVTGQDGSVYRRIQVPDIEDDAWVLERRGATIFLAPSPVNVPPPPTPNTVPMYTIEEGLRVRSAPGTDKPIIRAGLPKWIRLEVDPNSRITVTSYTWVRTTAPWPGWVAVKYLTTTAPK